MPDESNNIEEDQPEGIQKGAQKVLETSNGRIPAQGDFR